jgi:hypothetical protein
MGPGFVTAPWAVGQAGERCRQRGQRVAGGSACKLDEQKPCSYPHITRLLPAHELAEASSATRNHEADDNEPADRAARRHP